MRILAVDYGDSRIGLAVSDMLGIIASPVGTIKSVGMRGDIDAIVAKARELGAQSIIIGLPLNMDGSEGARAEKSRKIADIIRKVSGMNVELMDERLTTVSATRTLNEAGVHWSKQKEVVDTMSAQIILQTYLDKIKTCKE